MDIRNIIYSLMTGSTELVNYVGTNIRFMLIPENFDFNNHLIVYELDSEGITNILKNRKHREEYRLRIKVMSKNGNIIKNITDIIKSIYIYSDKKYNQINRVMHVRDVLIYEREYDVFTQNIDFDIIYSIE